jgi:ABC-type transport system involved in multi-copper enzyme maturation permease subunit
LRVRLGLGPVFAYEWLTTTRRWQLYALRAIFVSALLLGMMVVWHLTGRYERAGQTVSIETMASYGESFYLTIVSIELALVLLAAPAATAGAVCLDKARGTLEHLLATDLSNSEIVLGKLGVRLIPVVGLIACVVPIMALSGLLGGIDPTALFGSFLTELGCAVLGCSLALVLSVWGRKTHEVLMLTYLIVILWMSSPMLLMVGAYLVGVRSPAGVSQVLLDSTIYSNPFYLVYAPYSTPGDVAMTTYLAFLGGCLCASGMLVALAIARIRSVALKQAGQGGAKRQPRWARLGSWFSPPAWFPRLPGPSLDGNPIFWREWHRSRPSRFLRVVWVLYAALGVFWMIAAVSMSWGGRPGAHHEFIFGANTFQVLVGLLLLSVCAATSLAEERVRGSLDILLSTPLSTKEILAGKWWGAFRLAPHVLVWPAIMGGLLVADGGRVVGYLLLMALTLAYAAAIASLGLAISTWVSRLGRAVTICVSICVVFAIGWSVVVALSGIRDAFGLGLLMGSPIFGTSFATLITASRDSFPGSEDGGIRAGAFFSALIHGTTAVVLFAATLATFDSCLGRMSESGEPTGPHIEKKPPPDSKIEPDGWPDDHLVAVTQPPEP